MPLPRACEDKEWIQVWTPPTSQDLSVCLHLLEDFRDSPQAKGTRLNM